MDLHQLFAQKKVRPSSLKSKFSDVSNTKNVKKSSFGKVDFIHSNSCEVLQTGDSEVQDDLEMQFTEEPPEEDMESVLRAWDMDMRFGPCIGISRLSRWERAQRNSLSPPEEVRTFLVHGGANPRCLWENRV